VIKEIDHQVFIIVFEETGGCGLELSLRAHALGVAAPSMGLAGPRVLGKTCIIE